MSAVNSAFRLWPAICVGPSSQWGFRPCWPPCTMDQVDTHRRRQIQPCHWPGRRHVAHGEPMPTTVAFAMANTAAVNRTPSLQPQFSHSLDRCRDSFSEGRSVVPPGRAKGPLDNGVRWEASLVRALGRHMNNVRAFFGGQMRPQRADAHVLWQGPATSGGVTSMFPATMTI